MPDPFDYTEVANEALSMIQEFGRSVSFVKFDRDPVDLAKPWRGATDPRATPESIVAGSAVFVEPSSATALGLSVDSEDSMIKRSTQIMITALGGSSTIDLEGYDEVIDGSTRWRIEGVEKLKPATKALLYFVGVAR